MNKHLERNYDNYCKLQRQKNEAKQIINNSRKPHKVGKIIPAIVFERVATFFILTNFACEQRPRFQWSVHAHARNPTPMGSRQTHMGINGCNLDFNTKLITDSLTSKLLNQSWIICNAARTTQ